MIGRTVSRYRIIAKLGEGGMGSVWKAEDPLLGRTLALKFLPESLCAQQDARARFLREAQSASALAHSGIATVYDAGESDGMVYIALQHVDGETVAQRIERGRVEVMEASRIAMEAAEALGHAHEHGVLHRDVTSRNIMVSRDGRVIVVDFGLARSTEAEPESATVTEGTPYYVAPEKIKREKETFLSDMYSLGCTLYHALTGHVPFEAPTVEELVAAHVHTPLTPPNMVVTDITQSTSDALVKVMQKNPADRFLSYDEFSMALWAARSQLLVQQSLEADQPKPKSKTSWWRR